MKSLFSAVAILVLGPILVSAASVSDYAQLNLASDLAGAAPSQDTSLVNPWGLAATASSPFWINTNGTGLSEIYTGSGVKQGLVVSIPTPAGGTPPSAPTGIVANTTVNFGGAPFIFDTEDGTISSWKPTNTPITSAALQFTGPTGSVYKGLASAAVGNTDLLYATNFGLGRIDVFTSTFQPITTPGGFKDPNLPAGYAPFNIENINGDLYVTYALQDAAHHDDVAGNGHGFVDVFNSQGVLLQRLVTEGALNSPWGLALAPASFGAFSGDLLVGNFGNGEINAYNAADGAFLGNLDDSSGNPIVIQGLWGLDFGNGKSSGSLDSLYFTAGIPGPGMVEDHGLFGELVAAPEPAPGLLISGAVLLAAVAAFARRRSKELLS